ncbi:AI-2E family transporter, partial [Candidatus Peregrinibacteria bacterium]|nr:AI-2E family transporter [Candidatus Peregrinibacteria bacterium]
QNLSITAQGSVIFATRIAGSVVNFFVRMIVVLVLAFFIQSEKESIRLWFRGFFPPHYRAYIDGKIEAIHGKIGQWARGQLLLGLSIGLLTFLALEILGMPYALTLAVLAGFTEFIPYVGPFIAAIPAVLIALTQEGLLWAVILMGVYYVIQWCENNLLVPLIMKRAVGLSPIAIIASMLIGVSFPDFLHPILGLLLAIPATTIVTLFLEDWLALREKSPA